MMDKMPLWIKYTRIVSIRFSCTRNDCSLILGIFIKRVRTKNRRRFMPSLEKNDADSRKIGTTSTSRSVEHNVNKLQYLCNVDNLIYYKLSILFKTNKNIFISSCCRFELDA